MDLEGLKPMIARLQLEKVRLEVLLFLLRLKTLFRYLMKNKGDFINIV